MRLTRAESQQRTRALIVEAATRLFLLQGFQATSLDEVAEAAGFTRGAVYSNFENKTAMGIAVVDQLYEREAARLDAALEDADGVDAWFDALAGWARRTVGDPAWTRLEIEVAASSANDDAHRAATAERYARLRADCVVRLGRLGDALPAIDVELLATVVVAACLGTGLQRSADAAVDGAGWTEVLRAVAQPASAGSVSGSGSPVSFGSS